MQSETHSITSKNYHQQSSNKNTYPVSLDNVFSNSGNRPRHGKVKLKVDSPSLRRTGCEYPQGYSPGRVMLENHQITEVANIFHTGSLNCFISSNYYTNYSLPFACTYIVLDAKTCSFI